MPYRSAPLVAPPQPYKHSLWRRLVRLWWRFLRWRSPDLSRVHCVCCCAPSTETYRGFYDGRYSLPYHLCSNFDDCDARAMARQQVRKMEKDSRARARSLRAALRHNKERHYEDRATWLLMNDLIVLAEDVDEEHKRIKRTK